MAPIDFHSLVTKGSFLAFDVEGDGNPGQRPIEISFCEFVDGKFAKEHYFLLNPQRPISYFARKKHGISDRRVRDAPTFSEVAETIRDLVADRILVAHAATNDIKMMSEDMPDFLLLPQRILDTQRVTRYLGRQSGIRTQESLEKASAHFGVQPIGAPATLNRKGLHTSSTDAWMTGQLLIQGVRNLPKDHTKLPHLNEIFSVKVTQARIREIEERLSERACVPTP